MVFVVTACEQDPVAHLAIKPGYARDMSKPLPETELKLRKATIAEVNYELNLDITQQGRYAGTIEIGFKYTPTDFPLTIDFFGGEIERVWVNNSPVGIDYNGQFLSIPSGQLNAGPNRIKVLFSKAYGVSQPGLIRFNDVKDKRVYLFSNTGYNETHHLFPVFDQVDLKADLNALITAYSNWQVIFSNKASKVADRGSFNLWYFEHQDIAVEQIVLYAGDWHKWEGKTEHRPVNFLVRKSIKDMIPVRQWYTQVQQSRRLNSAFIKDQLQPLNIIMLPGLYGHELYHDHVAALSEQPLLYNSSFQPDWQILMTRQMVHSQLREKPWFQRWPAEWLSQHIIYQVTRQQLSDHDDERLVPFSQPLLTVIPSQQQPVEVTLTNKPLMTDKSLKLLDGLYEIADQTDIRNAVIKFLNTPQMSINQFLESINTDSTLAMSDWTSQWLSVSGVNKLQMSRHCEFDNIDVLTLSQNTMPEVPVVRQLNIKLSYPENGVLQQKELVMTSDRSILRNLDFLNCDTPVIVTTEPYIIINSDNNQRALFSMAKDYLVFDLPRLFSDAVHNQTAMTGQEFADWITLISSRLHLLPTHKLSQVLELMDFHGKLRFASSEVVKSASNKLANALYKQSLDQNRRVKDRMMWFSWHIKLLSEPSQANQLFTWLVGKSPPEDLSHLNNIKLQAYQRLLTLNHARVDLLYDYLNAQLHDTEQVFMDAIVLASLPTEQQIDYIKEVLADPKISQANYAPKLLEMANIPDHKIAQWLPYARSNLPALEDRLGEQFLQRWLQPVLMKRCLHDQPGTIENEGLSPLTRSWLSQIEPGCRLYK
jgi:aminopeptidase N